MTFLNGLELLSKLQPDVSLAGGDEYMQSIQQLQDTLQNRLLNEGCCINKPSYINYTPNDIHYLSDIIRIFGDLGIKYIEQHYTINELATINIEACIDVQRPNTFTTNYTDQTNINNKKENNEMNNNMSSN